MATTESGKTRKTDKTSAKKSKPQIVKLVNPKIIVPAFSELGDLSKYEAIVSFGYVRDNPTLFLLATLRDWGSGTRKTVPVYFLQLSVTTPRIVRKWIVPTDEDAFKDKIECIKTYIFEILDKDNLIQDHCPTLIFFGHVLDFDDTLNFLIDLVHYSEDSLETFKRCVIYDLDLKARLAAELKDEKAANEAREKGIIQKYEPLARSLSETYVYFQSDTIYTGEELQFFLQNYADLMFSLDESQVLLPLQDFSTVLSTIVLQHNYQF